SSQTLRADPQPPQRLVGLALDRPLAHAEVLGALADRAVLEEAEHDDRPLAGREPAEQLLEGDPVEDGVGEGVAAALGEVGTSVLVPGASPRRDAVAVEDGA